MSTSSTPFILSPLGPILKHDEDFKQIDNLSYLKESSINNNISDGVRELRYIQFQEILDLILGVGQYVIIIKKNVKDTIQKVLIAL